MNGKSFLVAAAAVAIAAIVGLLLFGDGTFFGGGSAEDRDAVGDGDSLTVGTDEGSVVGSAPADAAPALFGRGSQRIGVGDALGRVLSFDSKAPVAGAVVLLKGTGYGDEAVAVRATSGTDGRFHLARVPAGEEYVLTVTTLDAGTRTVSQIGLRAGDVQDLGTIWVGESGMLEGLVVDTLDRGVRDAVVQLHPAALSIEDMMSDFADLLGRLDQDPKPNAQVETDANGRFRIPGVAPGPATLIVRKPGYQVAIKPITMSKDGVIGETPIIRLEEADPISGRVVNQDGLGVARARIALIDQGDTETGFFARQFSETDDRGYFTIDSPPNAARLVAVVAAAEYPTLVRNFTADKRDGHVFQLVGGATLTIRIKAEETGAPIEGANILAMVSEEPGFGAKGGNMLSGVTDARGEVELLARPGYVPMVLASHPEQGSGMYMPQMMGAAQLGAGLMKGPKQVKLEAGKNELELLKPAGMLLTGRVTGPDGKPISGAKVGMAGQLAMFGGGDGVTNEDGVYELRVAKLPAMLLRVSVKAPGYVQPSDAQQIKTDGAAPVQHDVQMEYAAQIEGQVVRPDGTPLAGVQVRLRPHEDAPGGVASFMLQGDATAMTDRSGAYRFDTVQRGKRYVVVGRMDGYVDTATKDFAVSGGDAVVKAPSLTLQKGVELELHVIEPGGRDAAGARIDVHVERTEKAEWDQFGSWRSFAKVVTNADGVARVLAVPDGKVTLTVREEGFAGARKTIQVDRAQPPERALELQLREALTVSGRVVDIDGRPVAEANVQIQTATPGEFVHGTPDTDAQWTDMLNGETDADGRFAIKNAAPVEAMTLHIYAQGYQTKHTTVRAPFRDIEVTVQKIDKDKQRRIDELTLGIQEAVGKMQQAKDDEERQAMIKEMQEMQRELLELQSEAAPAVPGILEEAEEGGR